MTFIARKDFYLTIKFGKHLETKSLEMEGAENFTTSLSVSLYVSIIVYNVTRPRHAMHIYSILIFCVEL